jgi:hypothetical protein
MDNKRVLTELIGSMAVVYFAITSDDAMVTGLVLAVFMIAMGGTILPMFTIAKMAAGKDEIEDGALDFTMQILGGVLAYALIAWQTDAFGTNAWTGVEALGPHVAVASLFGGFLLMMVYERCGGGWEVGVLAWMFMLGGASLTGAGDIGGMLVDSAWSGANILAIFGGMVLAGIGGYLALMFGDQFLGEEE